MIGYGEEGIAMHLSISEHFGLLLLVLKVFLLLFGVIYSIRALATVSLNLILFF
jgi:hypothetical protein